MARATTTRRSSAMPRRPVLTGAGPMRRLPGTGPGGLSLNARLPESLAGAEAPSRTGRLPAVARAQDPDVPEPAEGSAPAAEALQGQAPQTTRAGDAALTDTILSAIETARTLTSPETDTGEARTPSVEAAVAGETVEATAQAETDDQAAVTAVENAPPQSEAVSVEDGAATPQSDAPTGVAQAESAGIPDGTDAPTEKAEVAEPSPAAAIAPAAAAVSRRASGSAAHGPPAAASGNAVASANDPATTRRRGAEGAGIAAADGAAQTSEDSGGLDQSSFETALRTAIRNAMPDATSEDDAREVMREGGTRAAEAVGNELTAQRDQAAGPLPAAIAENARPDPGSQDGGDVVALEPEALGEPPAAVSAAPVVPPASTEAAIDTSENRNRVDALEAENGISKPQLEKGNDPEFQGALGARAEAETNDREAPARLREAEAADRQSTEAQAASSVAATLAGFHEDRTERVGNVSAQQSATQGLTATRKAEITADIEAIGLATREAVTQILADMNEGATTKFQTAIDEALEAYDDAFAEEKGGFFTSVGDFLTGNWGDERFNRALAYGRAAFERRVERAITEIASFVETKLSEARRRVAEGRAEIDRYMTEEISESERQFAEDATTSITADFDALESEIASARDGLIDNMVDIYRQGIERRNAREEELREANKSFWERVYDATVGVIKKVIEFKNMLLGILARAAAVVEAIVKDPIGFLSNLIAGISAGLERFVANIAQNLQQALMGWLFGALEGAGIRLPERFDLKGFLDIILQVLGLTKENVRARAVRILGEDVVSKIETAIDFLRILFTEGPAAIWEMLLEKIGNLKDAIIEEIKSWLITKIIVAGIKWIVGLLNPASAFVKACMMIYDIVVFFIQRGQQIISAVNAIINALGTIVAGNISAMAQAVEGALNRILPVVIGFLASLLGLGGISDKIRRIIEAIQAPVNKAIDWVINLGVSMARKIAGLFGGGKTGEDEPQQATDPQVQAKIDAGLITLREEDKRVQEGGALSESEAMDVSVRVRAKHPVFKSIDVVPKGNRWAYRWKANPEDTQDGGEQEENENSVAPLELKRANFSDRLKKQFAKRYPYAHRPVGSKTIRPGYDRRHEIPFDSLRTEVKNALEGVSHATAVQRLQSAGEKWRSKGQRPRTKVKLKGDKDKDQKAINRAAQSWLNAKNNDVNNLWPGDGPENQALGAQPDPAPGSTTGQQRQTVKRYGRANETAQRRAAQQVIASNETDEEEDG